MFDETISLLSIFSYINTWLTPTVLFLLLNLMIGTIVVTSGFTSYKPQHHNHLDTTLLHHQNHQQPPPQQLTSSPSVLQRLKSINFYSFYSQTPSPSSEVKPEQGLQKILARVEEIITPELKPEQGLAIVPDRVLVNTETRSQTQTQTSVLDEDILIEDGPTLDEIYSKIKSVHHNRQFSDTNPIGGEIPVKLPAKIKKSASDKSAFNHFQAVDETENVPPILVEVADTAAIGGCEVDARADDFINRFKKQLQLQKMESIVRYKENVIRGSEQ